MMRQNPPLWQQVRLSQVGKLDGIWSWSIPAGEFEYRGRRVITCPFSKCQGQMDDACSVCYGQGGRYLYGPANNVRVFNTLDSYQPDFPRRMLETLQYIEANHPPHLRYFRWFDTGDVFSVHLARIIAYVVERTPGLFHWIPTRAYRNKAIGGILNSLMRRCENVVVRYSSPSLLGEYDRNIHGSTIIPNPLYPVGREVFICPAWDNEKSKDGGGICDGCRHCWHREAPVIAYIAHGRKAEKVLRQEGCELLKDRSIQAWKRAYGGTPERRREFPNHL